MKKNIILTIKGFFIGIANVIPGVSGGTLGMILGIYEELIYTISHLFHQFKKNLLFLLPIGIGMILAILLGSKVIVYALNYYTTITLFFFIGLIVGGIPLLAKKVKKSSFQISNFLLFLLTFGLVVAFSFLQGGEKTATFEPYTFVTFCFLILIGMITSATMIIPGISGSFVLMLLGYYKPIMEIVSHVMDFSKLSSHLLVLLPFGIGVLLGIIVISKLLALLFQKFEIKTYYAIMGFVFSSIVLLGKELLALPFQPLSLVWGVLISAIGFAIAYKLGDE